LPVENKNDLIHFLAFLDQGLIRIYLSPLTNAEQFYQLNRREFLEDCRVHLLLIGGESDTPSGLVQEKPAKTPKSHAPYKPAANYPWRRYGRILKGRRLG
jgi:hypothetical protein